MTYTDDTRTLAFDGVTLHGQRVCEDPDGYDRIIAWDPDTGERLVEIRWHRESKHLDLKLPGDRAWSFEAIADMRAQGEWALA